MIATMISYDWLIGFILLALTCLAGGIAIGIGLYQQRIRRIDQRHARMLLIDLRTIRALQLTARRSMSADDRCDALVSAARRTEGLINCLQEDLQS